MNSNYISLKELKIPLKESFDVIVCGGGPAGVCAAIAAARGGASTLLVETAGCLGGTWTVGMLGWMIDHGNKTGIIAEIKDELFRRNATDKPSDSGHDFAFDVETMKLILEEMCLEASVRIRLHTRVSDAVKNQSGELTHIITSSKSGYEAWGAKSFIDATGDGDLGFLAGASYEIGNKDTGLTQPMSLLAVVTGIELEEVKDCVLGYASWQDGSAALAEILTKEGAKPSYGHPSLFRMSEKLFFLMANHQYKKLGTSADDLTDATISARQEIHRQINALRRHGGVWKNLQLAGTAGHIGVREGRRIKGLYTVSAEDIRCGRRHSDAICHVTFGIDVHATDPDKGKGIEAVKFGNPGYDIPLRALISADIPNLLLTGRCISGDFLAHASYRVTGNTTVLGEAAGKLAAFSTQNTRKAQDIHINELS